MIAIMESWSVINIIEYDKEKLKLGKVNKNIYKEQKYPNIQTIRYFPIIYWWKVNNFLALK
jgi:hypothetical protein